MSTFSVFNEDGLKFNLRLLREGDRYGLDNCLTVKDDDLLVEFYDDRYPHTEDGQFITRYCVGTLLGEEGYYGTRIGTDGHGLALMGHVSDWSLDVNACNQVVRWLEHECK